MSHRERGDLGLARSELERAWTLATQLGDEELAGRIAITLSLVLSYQGELTNALAILDVSEPGLRDGARGRLRTQRGMILYQQGEFGMALLEYEAALELLVPTGDQLGELRQRLNLGALLSYLGRLDDARDHLVVAAELARRLDQTLARAVAEQNLAHVSALEGDFPAAFECFERASAHFRGCGYDGPLAHALLLDHARALLQANLLDDAQTMADRAVQVSDRTEGELDLPESLLVAAQVRLARSDVPAAIDAAGRSVAGFERLLRPAWAELARAVLLRAQVDALPSEALALEAQRNADRLFELGCRADGLRATLLATEVRVRLDQLEAADELLRIAAPALRSNVTLQPTALRLRALVEKARGNRAGARRAVNLGVRILDDHQAVLGALELRAVAAADSDGLAHIGVKMAIEDGRPRELLHQLEATRRTTSLLAAARPPEDDVLADLLAQWRVLALQQREAISDTGPVAVLDRERSRLEDAIRGHVRRAPAADTRADVPLAEAVRALGERALIEYANLDGRLYAVTVIDNRAALHDLGSVDGLEVERDSCVHALHRLNRVQGSDASRAAATTTLQEVGAVLAERIVPPRLARSDRPVVIVPTGVLHGLPWAVLPGWRGRAVSVAPSLTGWTLAARRSERVTRVGLIAGPELEHADAEVAELARIHAAPTVLTGPASTASRVLDVLASSDLAHVASHGAYRHDNPLFSTLRLADGPLTVFDLERCAELPRTIVLSACNVAMGTPLAGGALLGLASSLMVFGAGAVVAPLTPVSDERAVPLMVRFHQQLLAGASPAAALAGLHEDPTIVDPTAAAFIALGA
jgi:CHAT domain-containing protein/tetratricopeptide (TPR) repeat protein